MQPDTGRRSHSAVGAPAPRARWPSRCLGLIPVYRLSLTAGKPPPCKPAAGATAAAANAARLSAGFRSRIRMDGPEARRAAPPSGAGVSSPATEFNLTTTTALKGLMMKKTPQHFFTPCLKSFPLNRLQDVSKLSLGSDQGAMNLRAYTLCEVKICSEQASLTRAAGYMVSMRRTSSRFIDIYALRVISRSWRG